MLTTNTFETRVLKALREAEIEVRRILRIYPPHDTGDHSEVLFVDYNGDAATAYVDPTPKVVKGPNKGFGG